MSAADTLPRIGADEIGKLGGEVLLIDIRSPAEYRREHIAQTLCIAPDELAEKLPSAAELSKRKIRPRKWGAYAAFPEAKMLWATDKPYDSPEAASADALKGCRKASGQNCQTYTIYSNLCFAVAQGKRNGKPFTAFGYGPTESLAKSVGVANCRDQGAQNCEPVPGAPASCATPCNLISDKSCRYEQPAYIFPGKDGNKMKTMPSFFGRMGG